MNGHNNYQKDDLTAAEAFVLLNPNGDNSRQALSLLLREASLRGYITSVKGSRMEREQFLPPILSVLVILAIGVFLIPRGRGLFIILATLLLGGFINYLFVQISPKKPSKPFWLIQLTPKGRQILKQQAPSEWKPLLHYVEQAMQAAQKSDASNDACTYDELLRSIKKETASGGEFLDSHILRNLVNKGLLAFNPVLSTEFEKKRRDIGKLSSWNRKQQFKSLFGTPRNVYSYTDKGTSWRAQLVQQVQEARALPQYLRSRPEDALAIVSTVGILVLMVPHIEGHFGELGELLANGSPFDPLNPTHRNLSGIQFSADIPESEWIEGIQSSGDLLDGNLNGYERDFSDLPIGDGSDGGGSDGSGCSSDGDGDSGGGDGCGGGCGGGD
jgi:hypothetical protein